MVSEAPTALVLCLLWGWRAVAYWSLPEVWVGESIPIGSVSAWERHPSWGPRMTGKGLSAGGWTLGMGESNL